MHYHLIWGILITEAAEPVYGEMHDEKGMRMVPQQNHNRWIKRRFPETYEEGLHETYVYRRRSRGDRKLSLS